MLSGQTFLSTSRYDCLDHVTMRCMLTNIALIRLQYFPLPNPGFQQVFDPYVLSSYFQTRTCLSNRRLVRYYLHRLLGPRIVSGYHVAMQARKLLLEQDSTWPLHIITRTSSRPRNYQRDRRFRHRGDAYAGHLEA